MKPILFNTAMVQAILEGRKTTTRRIAKNLIVFSIENETFSHRDKKSTIGYKVGLTKDEIVEYSPYQIGEMLYVRETWQEWTEGYAYKVGGDYPQSFIDKWKPSIHMPKEAARIFLKVKDVRVERLQDITEEAIRTEGITEEWPPHARDKFQNVWDSTTKEYRWRLNPWVWVIEFERIDKSEVEQ